MLLRVLAFVFVSCGLYACIHKTVFNETVVEGRYSIAIPEYLEPTSDLHSKASAQYQSLDKEVYLVVLDDSKTFINRLELNYTLQSYTKLVLSQPFLKVLSRNRKVVQDSVSKTVNGNNILLTTIEGEFSNQSIVYKLAVIETPKRFYQLVVWVRADKLLKREAEMLEIIESFKEL